VAVTAADLTLPPAGTGKLDPAWYRVGELSTLLAVWIPQGEALVPDAASAEQADVVVTAYAYWQGYDTKAGQIAGDAVRENVGGAEFNREFLKFQQEWFENKAAFWRAAFEAAVEVEVLADSSSDLPRASFAQQIVRSF